MDVFWSPQATAALIGAVGVVVAAWIGAKASRRRKVAEAEEHEESKTPQPNG